MKREDKKLFYDEYLDGSKDYYYMTYGELVDVFGEDLANENWELGRLPDDYLEKWGVCRTTKK